MTKIQGVLLTDTPEDAITLLDYLRNNGGIQGVLLLAIDADGDPHRLSINIPPDMQAAHAAYLSFDAGRAMVEEEEDDE